MGGKAKCPSKPRSLRQANIHGPTGPFSFRGPHGAIVTVNRPVGKTTCLCSVENPLAPEDHDVERDRAEGEFAALGMVPAGSQRRAHQPLEQTVDGLNLPTLAVTREMQSTRHASPPVAARRLGGRPTDQRRNECVDAPFFTGILVNVLGVVSGIGHQRRDRFA